MNMIPQITHQPRNLAQQFRNLDYTTIPFESSSRRLAPPYRAYPVNDSRNRQSDPSEHLLRRKTPSGTLAAGYDGTPVHWSSKGPALKHVVLPVEDSSKTSNLNNDSSSKQRIRTRDHSDWDHQQATQSLHMHRQEGLNGYNNYGLGQAGATILPSPSDLSSSLWNQVHPQQQVFLCNTSIQVPTVLQPAYQPSPGPTASNDGGLYGPYWPDGRFVPYRPAAARNHFRDNGLVPSGAAFELHSDVHPSQQLPLLGHMSLNVGAVGAVDGHQQSELTSIHQFRRVGLPPVQYATSIQPETLLQNASTTSHGSGGSRTPTLQSVNRSGNPRFNEKTLSWAHAIYVDLLGFLHHSKKEKRPSQGFRAYSKNTIYPKPPRHLGSYMSSGQWLEAASDEGFSDPRQKLDEHLGYFKPKTPRWQALGNIETRSLRPSNQDMPHYVSPFQSIPQPADSPLTKAKEALEILTTLCGQSDWRWIDGMLLGGCLAYGLEEYQKALDWYSKIISLDPRHVEAMSNLAATLLCLNRREEAEQYWLQSVKLRPSYFEAVEHLIGLLCGGHRGQEAVSIIEYVERSLRLPKTEDFQDHYSETSSTTDRDSCSSLATSTETVAFDYDIDSDDSYKDYHKQENEEHSGLPGFASSGFSVPGTENGRILALVHAKGNMLYALGDIDGASKAFEDAVLISTGRSVSGIQDLIRRIVEILSVDGIPTRPGARFAPANTSGPLLLAPDKALQTARLVFSKNGDLPGLRHVPEGLAKKAAISTTSNSLLSLAKIFQDAMSNSSSWQRISRLPSGVDDILALYYLSLSLQPSPSTANNVGILLAGVQQVPSPNFAARRLSNPKSPSIPGVIPGSGIALALAYYNYGLNLDSKHAHIYTNLGSLLKDIGQLAAAITMYEKAVACDGSFDIALANLANAVKDQGRTRDAIAYYRRAVASSPDFAEAVCGLANALNSVCDWAGRGGVILDGGKHDRWHVNENGMIINARTNGIGNGWMKRVVDIVTKQLKDGSAWGRGTIQSQTFSQFLHQLEAADAGGTWSHEKRTNIQTTLTSWLGCRWEGARIVRLIERSTRRAMQRWYRDKYISKRQYPSSHYQRPRLPASLPVPTAPTVLPFHTFTCPLSARDIRMISQRNALRVSCSTLRTSWMPGSVYPPPPPPDPNLNIGYVSSDFNNHPLAHLMQSVFGLHDASRAKAFCYATTASDNSIHRQQIEREAPVFRDVSAWPAERLVDQITRDGIHILVNLNGYTRGARNEVFAARPAPIQMSFMGFAGTLGAEWCDYLLADETAIPPQTLRPWRRNIDVEDQMLDEQSREEENWVYSENIIFCRNTFFCCDHAQSEPRETQLSWDEEQSRRWQMRKDLFPSLSDDAIILGNFNQLYKIEPTTFRTWLRILDQVPRAILWLLRFPDLGESNLKKTAREWAGESVASRIWFTDVAPKHQHISRARVCDLFLDTPECNAHTTAADVLWSSTPLLTLPRYTYKMCSRMAASILKGALPDNEAGRIAAYELIAESDDDYEQFATRLAGGFTYKMNSHGYGEGIGRLGELRKLLYESRWTCALFDTRRWVSDLESAYEEAWRRWVSDEGGDIFL